ncbi:MAG TPA: lysylphosphatidylglycerol synthase transmembrane domain-containing protein [Anaeromyxobacteraceae bacterium]|nr:lysylphosphatidylglycerol synthase transmembrane domain-containing protein [Anaeromyxobacteraceae bacterium]
MPAPAGRTWTSLRLLAAVAVLGVCLYYLARRIEPALLGRALARADYHLVLVMTSAHLALFLSIKTWRWQIMLAPIRHLPLTRLYQYCLAGCAITNLFPARAGQAVRVVLLRRDAVPVTSSIGVLALEEISNAAVLGLLCLPLPFLLSLPVRVHFTLGFVTGGAAVALGVLVWLALAGRARPGGLLRRISEGLAVLGRGRAALAVLGLTVAMWLVDLGQIALAMWAVGVPPSYAGVALVLLLVNVTNALPVTPGQVGLFEAGATAACVAIGATPEQGLAVGVLYHFTQLIPETVIGLSVLGRGALGRTWRAARVEAASES